MKLECMRIAGKGNEKFPELFLGVDADWGYIMGLCANFQLLSNIYQNKNKIPIIFLFFILSYKIIFCQILTYYIQIINQSQSPLSDTFSIYIEYAPDVGASRSFFWVSSFFGGVTLPFRTHLIYIQNMRLLWGRRHEIGLRVAFFYITLCSLF